MTDQPFDLTGPLPQPGITVLEASAGTGKTYTIAGLAARYVAEGVPLDKLLLVTFTILATSELRERVRERLVIVERELRTGRGDDPVARQLGEGDGVAARLANLQRALADFDAATIATTHGFCLEMLSGLGVDGDLEPDHTFAEDVGDLVDEVVDDLYVRRFHLHGKPAFSRGEAGTLVRAAAVQNPVAPLEPPAAGESTPAMRRRLADVARTELDARKRRRALMTYDDLLTRLNGALDGAGALKRLQERFQVVLVDEFQDTDPVQWSILAKAFGTGVTRLILIGDPKQAIYAFRGADVFAYLGAARAATTQRTLQTNWRSDGALLHAYDALFGNAHLGHPGIAYRQVDAAHPERRLVGAPDPAALRFRVVFRDDIGTTRGGAALKQQATELIADDLAVDVVGLLKSGATIDGRTVAPKDLAVLVRSHVEAAQIRDALTAAGVPVVVNGAGSVFEAPAASEWLALLEALERPSSPLRAHGVARTCFLGWTAEQVATATEAEWEDVHARLHDWARILRVRGVASLAEAITLMERLPERVLATSDGERRLTDLRHLGQLLHAAATGEGLGPTALSGWLRRRVADARRESGDEERSRRLESDAAAVQVLTIHRSKGLEFPIVYYPFMWHGRMPGRTPSPVVFHDGEQRTLDVGLAGPDYDDHVARALLEDRGEDLRLAYVALTRAKHQAVVWWAGTHYGQHSALSRLLFCREPDGTVPGMGKGVASDRNAIGRCEAIAAQAPGCVSVARASVEGVAYWPKPVVPESALSVRPFDRHLDWRWKRTSYSDITAGAHDARVASEPEEPLLADEPEAAVVAPAVVAEPVPLADMPVGVHVGTFVHRLLEELDFAAPDLEAEVTARVAEQRAWRSLDVGDPVAGLVAALRTPLLADGLRLCDVTHTDRLDELGFELPLAGGDTPTGELTLAAIADVLRRFGEPVPGYADRLADAALKKTVRGYLTGSVDLVFRHEGRFTVVDYKTNWLGAAREDYAPAALAVEMDGYHYALQALLYTVAVHRYLRWRLPAYDPALHLGGVRYLFLRGMVGTAGTGVFAWDPPAALVTALSDVLDGRA